MSTPILISHVFPITGEEEKEKCACHRFLLGVGPKGWGNVTRQSPLVQVLLNGKSRPDIFLI